ncbi:MAG: NAD(P)H-dependent oxidoreductase [Euryarchaeota archaeon]|nr:NAD(P)H-dependent oxidoreductase [Euryarchaeota archaeon]
MVKILGVVGSLREGSNTRRAVDAVLQAAKAAGAETSMLDLAEVEVPMFHPERFSPEFDPIRQRFAEADGFVIGSPEYHGSYSGTIKNLLDHLSMGDFDRKAVALVSTGSSFNALNDLRTVFRWLHAWVLPSQVLVRHVESDEMTGEITNAKVRVRLEELGHELSHWAMVFREHKPK